jgi:hypothetical protein
MDHERATRLGGGRDNARYKDGSAGTAGDSASDRNEVPPRLAEVEIVRRFHGFEEKFVDEVVHAYIKGSDSDSAQFQDQPNDARWTKR